MKWFSWTRFLGAAWCGKFHLNADSNTFRSWDHGRFNDGFKHMIIITFICIFYNFLILPQHLCLCLCVSVCYGLWSASCLTIMGGGGSSSFLIFGFQLIFDGWNLPPAGWKFSTRTGGHELDQRAIGVWKCVHTGINAYLNNQVKKHSKIDNSMNNQKSKISESNFSKVQQ